MSLSAVMGWWAFSPPYFSATLPTPGQGIDLLLFMVAAIVIIWVAAGYRTVLWKLKEEELFREATVNGTPCPDAFMRLRRRMNLSATLQLNPRRCMTSSP